MSPAQLEEIRRIQEQQRQEKRVRIVFPFRFFFLLFSLRLALEHYNFKICVFIVNTQKLLKILYVMVWLLQMDIIKSVNLSLHDRIAIKN